MGLNLKVLMNGHANMQTKRDLHRCFVAVVPPNYIKQAIANGISPVKQQWGELRWVDLALYHITLEFLGNITDREIDTIKEHFVGLRFTGFKLNVGRIKILPAVGRPRVVCLDLMGQVDLLELLHSEVRKRLRRAGAKLERRRFVAHLTVARVPERVEESAALMLRSLDGKRVVNRTFTVTSLYLMESHLSREQPRYTMVARLGTAYPELVNAS